MFSSEHIAVQDAAQRLAHGLTCCLDALEAPAASVVLMGASDQSIVDALGTATGTPELTVHLMEPAAHGAAWSEPMRASIKQRLHVHRGPHSDLRINAADLDTRLRTVPCRTVGDWNALLRAMQEQSSSTPLIAHDSIDVVVMNLVVNCLAPAEAEQALLEAFRVLRRQGTLLMSVVLADEAVAGGAAGSARAHDAVHFPVEMELFGALERAGYHGMRILNEERSVVARHGRAELAVFVIEARKGKQGPCLEQGHAVMLRGPWSEAYDDDGHRYVRGERTAVCAKTYALLMSEPYRGMFIGIPAHHAPALEHAGAFDCATPRIRHPGVTKGVTAMTCDPVGSPSCC